MYNLQSLEQRMDRVDYQVISDDKDKRIADLEQQLELIEKALELAIEYMFNVMCADDVPSIEWFIKCAKEMMKSD